MKGRRCTVFFFFFLLLLQQAGAQVLFTADKRQGCLPLIVSFSDRTSGSPTSWDWDFGDGSTHSVQQHPVHTYTSPGFYSVRLKVNYADGTVRDTVFQKYIHTSAGPSVHYSCAPDSVCPGEAVAFTPYIVSNEGIRAVSWDYKDGYTDTARRAQHAYRVSGRYRPALRVTDTLGCTGMDSVSGSVYVKPKPKADFYTPDSLNCIRNASDTICVKFVNTSRDAVSYSWSFDDGGTSAQAAPSHCFAYGDYDISLAVRAANGCTDTLLRRGHVSLSLYQPSFTVSDSVLCKVPGTLTFTGYGARYYRWRISDSAGHIYEKMASEYKPTFKESGIYDVRVICQHQLGCTDTLFRRQYIWVFDSFPEPELEYQPEHCDSSFAFPFRNVTEWDSAFDLGMGSTLWNFGDGNGNQQGDSLTHVFGSYGIKEVTCYATTPFGCPLPERKIRIYIRHFSEHNTWIDPSSGCKPLKTLLWGGCHEDSCRYFPFGHVDIRWGDGDSTRLDSSVWGGFLPSNVNFREYHTYEDTGYYFVDVEAVNTAGCAYTRQLEVAVGLPPKYYWEYDSLGERCLSDFRLEVFGHDSLYWDPVLQDSVPVAGYRSNYWKWLQEDTAADGTTHLVSVGEGDHTHLKPRYLGYSRFAYVAYHNGCPGEIQWKDSVAYACPPIARISPDLEPSTRQLVHCEYPEIRFHDSSVCGTGCIWYFGEAYFSHPVHWEGDTSQRRDTLYRFHEGSYMKDGRGYGYATLISVNDDSTGSKGMYNRCKICYDTTYRYVRILLPEAHMAFNSPLCEGDELVVKDTSFTGGVLSVWDYSLERLDGRGVVFSKQFKHRPYKDSAGRICYDLSDSLSRRIYEPGDYLHKIVGYAFFDHSAIGRAAADGYEDVYKHAYPDFCEYRDSALLKVYPKSFPDFSAPVQTCAGDSVQFWDQSETPEPYEDSPLTYLWQTAGRSDTAQNPVYVFPNGGKYSMMLRVTNRFGCDSGHVFKDAIFIQGVNASWKPKGGQYTLCNKAGVRLSSSVAVQDAQAPLAYRWNINGGKFLYRTKAETYGKDATVAFDVDSSQFVRITLFVTDSVTGCTSMFTDSLYVHKPATDFVSSQHFATCPELKVDYCDTTPDGLHGDERIVKWEWWMEDRDDTVYVLGRRPGFVYSHSGSYGVKLAVTDDFGCTDTLYRKDYVQIGGADGFFVARPNEGCMPLTVDFSVRLFQHADTVRLIFGDGGSMLSDVVSATGDSITEQYTYTAPGIYVPSMEMVCWALDADGSRVRCVQQFVGKDTVFVVQLKPEFGLDTLLCVSAPCTFRNLTDEAHGNIFPAGMEPLDSLRWDYGNGKQDTRNFDGSTSYDSAGIYAVVLKVARRHCEVSDTQYLRVIGPPDIRFTHQDTTSCDEVLTTLTADSLRGDETAFDWNFHDGEQCTDNPVTHPYDRSGRYPLTLTLTYSPIRCTHTYYDTVGIQIFRSPVAAFRMENKNAEDVTDLKNKGVPAGEKVVFTDLSRPGDAPLSYWKWVLGNGDSLEYTASNHPEYTYRGTSGMQHVQLYIRDTNGCRDSVSHEVLVTEFLTFPNVFSPNGDGTNDFFTPLEAGGYFEHFEMTIYNRWGGVVWQRNCQGGEKGRCPDYDAPDFWWNGCTATGKEASAGVYFWVVCARPKSGLGDIHLHGSVTLVR